MSYQPKDLEDIYELSPLQQLLLDQTLREPGNGTACRQTVFAVDGLDARLFRQAWEKVVERQPPLRASVHWEGLDKPLQVIHRRPELLFEEQDWRGLRPRRKQFELRAYLAADSQRGFVLTEAPLLRLALFRLSETFFQFVWSHHPLLLDDGSAVLVSRSFFSCYQALSRGQPHPLASPGLYRDYLVWIQHQDPSRTEQFWRQYLQGFTAATPLPLLSGGCHAPPAVACQENEQLEVPGELTTALRTLAQREQLTLDTLVQGAWALLLGRHSGHEEVVFGARVAGRPRQLTEADSMVGLFTNTLPVRVRLHPQEQLLSWLKNLHARQIEALPHEYLPLVQVQRWSEVRPNLPLFESLVAFENYPKVWLPRGRQQSLKIRSLRPSALPTGYPLTLVLEPGETGLLLRLAYTRDRCDENTAAEILDELRFLLADLVTHPERRLGEGLLVKSAKTRGGFVPGAAALVDLQPRGSGVPFFCIHGSGGTVFRYRELARHLGQDRPLFALQARGLDGTQWPHARIEDMAADYLPLIQAVQPQGPFLLGGWSLGGMVAFEMAQQLEAQGQSVALLVLVDTVLGEGGKPAPKKRSVKQMAQFARGQGLRLHPGELKGFPPEARLGHVVDRLQGGRPMPPRQSLAQAHSQSLLYERLRWFHNHAMNQYCPRRCNSRIVLCLSGERPAEEIAVLHREWNRLAPRVELEIIPGSHGTMIAEPGVKVLAERLRTYFQDALAPRGPTEQTSAARI